MKKIFKKKIKPLVIDDLFIAGGSILVEKMKITIVKDVSSFYKVLDDLLMDSDLSIDCGFDEMDFLIFEKRLRLITEEEANIVLDCLNKIIKNEI
jgi:hypothetical protein